LGILGAWQIMLSSKDVEQTTNIIFGEEDKEKLAGHGK
jgi:hypothetical protein